MVINQSDCHKRNCCSKFFMVFKYVLASMFWLPTGIIVAAFIDLLELFIEYNSLAVHAPRCAAGDQFWIDLCDGRPQLVYVFIWGKFHVHGAYKSFVVTFYIFFSLLKFKLLENVRFTLSRYSFDDSSRNIKTVVLKPRQDHRAA